MTQDTGSTFTPEQDAEDMGLVVREARTTAGLTPAQLGHAAGTSELDVITFEAGRTIPAQPRFSTYMQALGYSA